MKTKNQNVSALVGVKDWADCEKRVQAVLAEYAKGADSKYKSARVIAAFEKGDLAAARREQMRSVQLVKILAARGYMACAKAVMGMLGVSVGPARLPHGRLTATQVQELKRELEALGFFEWIR